MTNVWLIQLFVLLTTITLPSRCCSLYGNLIGNNLTKSLLTGCSRDTTVINVGGNRFTTVANDAFDGFYALEHIYLDDNHLSDLPVGLFDGSFKSSLTHIYARNNSILSLNNDLFRNNFNLIVIDVAFNDINFIGGKVFHEDLTKLLLVNISHNKMSYFEPWPYVPNTPPNDQYDLLFDASYNLIDKFTNTINWTYDLQEPYEHFVLLQFNKLANFSNDLVFQYRDIIDGQSILTELLTYDTNITNNPFFCDCNVYDIVSDLHKSFFLYYRVDEWRYRCASPAHLAGIDFLHDLDLDEFVCNRTDNCPVNCTCQDQPHISTLVINCTNANLRKLPETIPSLAHNIKYVSLYLNGNRIKDIINTNYTNIVKNLTISNNLVDYINGETLKKMENLEKLDISGNSLRFIPKEIQKLSFDNVKIRGNPFECKCNMTWMADWMSLSGNTEESSITCSFDGETQVITKVTEDSLDCNFDEIKIIIIVVAVFISSLFVVCIIIAKRCPYETKVLVYKLFKIHPRDRYVVDREETKEYDAYLSFDGEDIQVRQWIKTVFMKKLEEGKKKYRFYCPLRDTTIGDDYGPTLVNEMTKSRRVFVLLSPGFFKDQWRIFETDQAEIEHNGSDDSHPRVVYLIWNDKNSDILQNLQEEPWKSRLNGKRVLSPDEKFFWSKIRYELPIKPRNKISRVDNSYTNIQAVARNEQIQNNGINVIYKQTKARQETPVTQHSCIDLQLETIDVT